MLFLFDKNEGFYDELPVDSLSSCVQTEPINGIVSLSFTVTIDYIDRMKDAVYIGHRDVVNDKFIQVYKIVTNKTADDGITYNAVHIVHDELTGYGYIREKRLLKTTAAASMRIALEGSRWQVGKTIDTQEADVYFYDNSRQEAVAKILKTWDVELGYRIVFDGNTITARYIDIYKTRGIDTGRRYVYGFGALSVVKETSQESLYTAAIGRGKGEEKFDAKGEATGGYGRRINFKNIEWKKDKGDPVDKPLGQEFVELPDRTVDFGYSDGTARIKVVVYDDIEDPKTLLRKTYDDLLQNSRPLVQFESTIEESGDLEIGDRVAIIRKDLDIYYYTRVFEIERDLLSRAMTKISLGDALQSSPGAFRLEVRSEIQKANEKAEELRRSAGSEIEKVQKSLTDSMWDDNAYYYRLDIENKYHLPPGLYTFDRPIDENPSKVIYFGAGKMAVSNKKDSNGQWIWSTWATGDGFTADLMRAGRIVGGKFRLDLETGHLNIGDKLIYDPATEELHFASGSITMGSLDSDTQEKIQGAYDSAKELEKGYTEIKEGEARFVTKSQLGTVGETSINGYNITTGAIRSQNGATNIDLNGSAFTFGFGAMTYEKSKGLRIGGDRFYMTSDNRCFAIHSNEWVNGRLGGFRGTTNANGATDGVMLYASHGFHLRLCTQLDQEDNTYANHLILFHNRSGDVWTEIVCDTFVRAKLSAIGSGTIQATEMRSSSDIRLKKDIKPWDVKALDVINATDFIRFRWKDGDDTQEHYGVSAQSIPMAQVKRDDGYLAVDGYTMNAINGRAIQELSHEVKRLKKENEEMKKELENLKEAVHDLVERS